MQIGLDELPGRSVIDASGRVLGEVDGLQLDTDSWGVQALRIRLRRSAAEELGLSWSPFRAPMVEVPTQLVLAASDAVILRATVAELQQYAAESLQMQQVAPPAH